MYDDDCEWGSPHTELKARLNAIECPVVVGHTLNELLYTASETGLIDGISDDGAKVIWKLIELAKQLGEDLPTTLRM